MKRCPAIAPGRSSLMRRRADILEVRFGDGVTQRRPRFGGAVPRREWHLFFDLLTTRQIAEIDRFLESHGGVTAFLWTPPHGRPGTYLCAAWQVTPAGPGLAGLSAVFTEEGQG